MFVYKFTFVWLLHHQMWSHAILPLSIKWDHLHTHAVLSFGMVWRISILTFNPQSVRATQSVTWHIITLVFHWCYTYSFMSKEDFKEKTKISQEGWISFSVLSRHRCVKRAVLCSDTDCLWWGLIFVSAVLQSIYIGVLGKSFGFLLR